MYLALPVSTGGFPRAIHVSRYSRTETKKILCFRSRDYYPLGSCFPAYWTNKIFCNFSHNKLWRFHLTTPPYYPCSSFPTNKDRRVVWALSFSLAATKEMSFLRTLFYFPPGTEMFYFPGCALWINSKVMTCSHWVSPFRNFRINGC